MSERDLQDVDIAILAGGLGTRIARNLGETPKVLAPINGRTYLDHLLDWLEGFGVSRIIMCLGHLSKPVIKHLGGRPGIKCFVEPTPLGTGGALRFCRASLKSKYVLVMNGDTWLETDLRVYLDSHRSSGRDLSMICIHVDNVSRFGTIILDGNLVVGFVEKDHNNQGPGYINGGVYLMTQAGLDRLCDSKARSIEMDYFFPQKPGTIHAFVPDKANFIDIGTPASLAAAAAIFPKLVDC